MAIVGDDRRKKGSIVRVLGPGGTRHQLLCPRGLRVLQDEKERERRGWTGLLETIGKGGKDWRANGVLPEGNWRGL